MSEAPKENWIDDACAIFDGHAKDLGWVSHIYSQNLRELVAKNDRLTSEAQAATEKAAADALRDAVRVVRDMSDRTQAAWKAGSKCDTHLEGQSDGLDDAVEAIEALIPPEQQAALDAENGD